MKIIISKKFCNFFGIAGITLAPFIILKFHLYRNSNVEVHETIHLKQQYETLIIPFYVIYLLSYLVNLVRYRSHDLAYRYICFEDEAYENEKDFDYIKNRKMFSWIKYIW